MLIAKLMFYLFLYDHYLACIWHYTILQNGPQTFFVQEDLTYIGINGDILYGADDLPVLYNGTEVLFGKQPIVAQTEWNRLKPVDALGWRQYNSRWDSRATVWIMPVSFVNPGDQTLHIESNI